MFYFETLRLVLYPSSLPSDFFFNLLLDLNQDLNR